MRENLKKIIGNFVIDLGNHAVGKCMIPGMFDPQIPDVLKSDEQKKKRSQVYNHHVYRKQ